jgi:hypothetical protein
LRILLIVVSIMVMMGGAFWVAWQKGAVEIDWAKKQVKFDAAKLTFEEIFNEGNNMKCIYKTETTNSGWSMAFIYIWGKKVYANYSQINAEGVKHESFMLVGDKNIYAWTDPESPGIVMPAEKREAQLTVPQNGDEFSCQSWTPIRAMFEPPSNIKFVNYKTMQDQQCGPCEYLTNEQRDFCRKVAGCDTN